MLHFNGVFTNNIKILLKNSIKLYDMVNGWNDGYTITRKFSNGQEEVLGYLASKLNQPQSKTPYTLFFFFRREKLMKWRDQIPTVEDKESS